MEPIAHYLRPKGEGLKLHLGCGDYYFSGYINLDRSVYGGTDMLVDLTAPLPFQPEVVEVIESYEFVEHFTRAQIDPMLEDWKRVLIPEGRIISVVPDIDELMRLGLIDQIYGVEQDHKWGYTVDSLRELFERHGFKVTLCEKREMANRPGEPKIYLECNK